MLSSVRASDANDHKRCGRGDKDVRCALRDLGSQEPAARRIGASKHHDHKTACRAVDATGDARLEDALFMHALFRRGER